MSEKNLVQRIEIMRERVHERSVEIKDPMPHDLSFDSGNLVLPALNLPDNSTQSRTPTLPLHRLSA
jgi:hypothetical protein